MYIFRSISHNPSFGPQLRPSSQTSSATSSQKSPLKACHELRPTGQTLPPDDELICPLYSKTKHETREPSSPTGSTSSVMSKVSLRDIAFCDRQPAVRKRTLSPGRMKVVPVDSIMDSGRRDSDCSSDLTPSPPSSGRRTDRLSSADRFRNMVIKNREQPA